MLFLGAENHLPSAPYDTSLPVLCWHSQKPIESAANCMWDGTTTCVPGSPFSMCVKQCVMLPTPAPDIAPGDHNFDLSPHIPDFTQACSRSHHMPCWHVLANVTQHVEVNTDVCMYLINLNNITCVGSL